MDNLWKSLEMMMPFKSKAQQRFLYANLPDVAAEFQQHTPKTRKLVARVRKGGDVASPKPRTVGHTDDLRGWRDRD